LGLVTGLLAYLLTYGLSALIRDDELRLNAAVDWETFFSKFWWVLPTTAVQDFLVAGYCYHKLIRLTNVKVATIILFNISEATM
jgi:hypothetical protein